MERDRRILRYLATHDGWATSAVLSTELGCSVRSVKSDVKKLNTAHPGIIKSGRSGFSIGDRSLLSRFDPVETSPIPQSPEERRSAILRALLMGRRETTLERLSDELCVSSVTLTKDLARVKLDMAEFGLEVHSRGGLLRVVGGEANEKRMVASLIFNETKGFFNQLDVMRSYFPDLDMQGLRDEIELALERHRLFLNDYVLANFILHVAIVLERGLNGFGADPDDSPDMRGPDKEVEMFVAEVCDVMEGRYGIRISSRDRVSFSVILSTRLEGRDTASVEFVGDKVMDFVRRTLQRVSDEYGITLEGEAFLIRFGLHIKNMVLRLESAMTLRNPQTASIRNDYPFVYDIAVFIAQAIHAEQHITIPDDEIAYIALHIGCLIEEQSIERSKVRCVLVSPNYNDNGIALAWRILCAHESSIVMEGVVDSIDRLPANYRPDLIISTTSLAVTPPFPVVEISPFLGQRDLTTLRAHLEMVRSRRHRKEMEERLRTLFSQQLFFCNAGFTSRDNAVETMGAALIAEGCARSDYIERLREREAISSSAFLDIALPHPLDMDALRTAIAVSVHPEPLDWAGTPVYLVFMLAIHPEDKSVFRHIFDFVTDALYDRHRIQEITSSTSFEEFLDMLLGYV